MEQLFGSKTRVKLLQLFFNSPNRPYYVREITRKIDEQINSVRRELGNLLNIGILKSSNRNNRLYYEVNQKFKHYKPMRALFSEMDADEAVSAPTDKNVKQLIKELGSVDVLAYMGTFTNDPLTGIDVMIVGDVNRTKVSNFMAALEAEEGRELRFAVMGREEFDYRRDVKDRFLATVENAKKTVIHDPAGLFEPKAELVATAKKEKA